MIVYVIEPFTYIY